MSASARFTFHWNCSPPPPLRVESNVYSSSIRTGNWVSTSTQSLATIKQARPEIYDFKKYPKSVVSKFEMAADFNDVRVFSIDGSVYRNSDNAGDWR